MSVDYSKKQAEQVIRDFNAFIGYGEKLDGADNEFINHKFPPKIEYVGKVWKVEDRIFLCTKQDSEGHLHGYGIDKYNEWFLREDISVSACCCNSHFLDHLTQATLTEWQDALKKYAESKYKVGDEVVCLTARSKDVLKSINCATVNESGDLNSWWGISPSRSGVVDLGTLLMRYGVWATIITPAKKTDKEVEFDSLTSLWYQGNS